MELYGTDVRKGTPSIPYAAHLLSVCALVLLDGGTEEEAIAGLLHDALEDHPEATSRRIIAERFGEEVRVLVEACSDTPPDYRGGPKPPWKGRKAAYLYRLETAGPKERRVSLADKLDNARSIVADYHAHGDLLWSRFNAGKEDQLWFLRSLNRFLGRQTAEDSSSRNLRGPCRRWKGLRVEPRKVSWPGHYPRASEKMLNNSRGGASISEDPVLVM